MTREITLTGNLESETLDVGNAPKLVEIAEKALIEHTFVTVFSGSRPTRLEFFYGEQKPDVRLVPGNWAFAGLLADFVVETFIAGFEFHGELEFIEVGRCAQRFTVANGEVFVSTENFTFPDINKPKTLVEPTIRFL